LELSRGNEAESKSVAVEDQQRLKRAVDHYPARLLQTASAQDYLRARGVTVAEKLPAEGRRALRRVGVLTGSGRELLRGCVIFPLVAAGQVVDLYGRSIEGRRHLQSRRSKEH